MKYRIVQNVKGLGFDKNETQDIVAFMEVRGHKLTGYNDNPMNRVELQGQPTFQGFCGPMWDGDAIRYEDTETYARLSA